MGKALFLVLPAAVCLVGCAVLGGTKKVDPLAGWGGVWVGEYRSEAGVVGTLELEFTVDMTTGAPLGVARFGSEGGARDVQLREPVLTADSIITAMEFEGLYTELRGARTPVGAEGVYVIWPATHDEILDSGTWRVTSRLPR